MGKTDTQTAIFKKIQEATEAIPKEGRSITSYGDTLVQLALAYRYASGGSQPGGGCNCSK